ncbi:ATP-binding protein [Streptomyces sp. NPDC002812]|uniref:ATP-binding protein n=1 Tax=Streptomyces sp. NPDC002812 TaxID=3154434 RepID=UPI00331DAF34
MSGETTGYDASHLQVLEGWKAVRKRPGMYIGSSGERGLHNMVFEVADRAVNELLAGRASSVEVTLTPDGGVRVTDDGPGVPIDEAGSTGGPGLEALLTSMQSGAGPGGRDDVTLGFCGVGPFVVNALSRRMTAEVRREGIRWVQEYARGVAVTKISEAGTTTGSGITIAFWPDTDIFETAAFSFDTLAERFRELAFLNRALDILLIDRRQPGESRSARFWFPGGARDFVAFLDAETAAPIVTEAIAFEFEDPRMAGTAEVAFRWSGSHEERLRSFANSRPTIGGTHELGFRDGVTDAVNAFARERLLLAETDPRLDADWIGEGLTAVVSVKLDHPEFEGATHGVLGNPPVRTCMGQAVQEHLGTWLEGHPEQAAVLVGRVQRARQH